MRPTFSGFETAKTAIFTNQKAIDIVGHNISNIHTTGYTRQSVDRASIATPSRYTKVASNQVGLKGQGVEALGVSQTRDSFLDKRFREQYTQTAYHSQVSDILSDIQTALGDGADITSESGLFGAMQSIYESLNDFIQNPTMETEANIVMSAFRNITQVLSQMDERLTTVADQQTVDLQITTDRANEILAQIAYLNDQIGNSAEVLLNPNDEYHLSNELLDERNLLLDELSGYADIHVTELSNGMVNVELGGYPAVTEESYTGLQMNTNNDGTVAIRWLDSGESIIPQSGSILASMDYLNGRGINMQSNTETQFQGIPYYRDQINTFAATLAQMVNTSVPMYDETTGEPMVDANGNVMYKEFLAASIPGGQPGETSDKLPVTAANITISQDWTEQGAGYFIYNPDVETEDYAQLIASRFADNVYTFDSYGEKFTGTFIEYNINMTTKLASDISFHEGRRDSYAKIADDFLDTRDSVSAVSQDEETTDLLKYQKSYEAAARVMTTLDEMLDVIVNRMGRVGL